MNRRYLLVVLVVCLLVGSVQAWGADFGAWKYRKEITVNNTGSNLTNYQVLFTVNRSAGSDSGFTVYLDGKCESDYDDIRFTTSDENTLCDYWIESNSSTVASVWVEVPTIAGSGDTTIYLYYGNSGASAVSNGTNTFPFFEDWASGSLDAGKFNAVGAYSISGGVISQTNSNSLMIFSKNTFDVTTNIIRARSKQSAININYGLMGGFSSVNTGHNIGSYQSAFMFFGSDCVLENVQQGTGETITAISTSDPANDTNYYITEMRKSGSTNYLTVTDSTGVTGSASSSSHSTSTTINYIEVISPRTGLTVYNDWVLVRQYTATSPTVSAWGSEEEEFPRNLLPDFSGVPTSGYVPLTVYFTDPAGVETRSSPRSVTRTDSGPR